MFATAALQQTNVELAWDQDDPKRNRLTMKDFAKGDYKDEAPHAPPLSHSLSSSLFVSCTLRPRRGFDENPRLSCDCIWRITLSTWPRGVRTRARMMGGRI